MKDYVNYFESIDPPEELINRLRGLKEPVKKPFPVARVAGIAAALAVVLGLGAALSLGVDGELISTESGRPEMGPEPDIAIEPGPGSGDTSGSAPMGWYQIVDGEFIESIGYPVLNFADASGLPQIAVNYTLGAPGGSERALTAEDLEHLLGERFLEHLGLPADTAVSGTLWFTSDRAPCGAEIILDAGDRSLYIEELADHPVPSCVEPPDETYGHTEYHGADVRTLTNFYGESSCEVSFLLNGTGWKATVRGENYEELASRFVRLAVDDRNAGLKAARWEYAPPPETPGGSTDGTVTAPYNPNK